MSIFKHCFQPSLSCAVATHRERTLLCVTTRCFLWYHKTRNSVWWSEAVWITYAGHDAEIGSALKQLLFTAFLFWGGKRGTCLRCWWDQLESSSTPLFGNEILSMLGINFELCLSYSLPFENKELSTGSGQDPLWSSSSVLCVDQLSVELTLDQLYSQKCGLIVGFALKQFSFCGLSLKSSSEPLDWFRISLCPNWTIQEKGRTKCCTMSFCEKLPGFSDCVRWFLHLQV